MFTGLIERIGRVKAHSPTHDRLTIELMSQEDLRNSQLSLSPSTSKTGAHDDGNHEFFVGLRIGDSISIDGVCLTVVKFDKSQLSFDVNLAPETLSRTNLGSLQVLDLVNLERALSSSTRFGGHFVQGHIDKTGKIVSKTQDQDSIRITIEHEASCPKRQPESNAGPKQSGYSKYLIPKGYVAIDGISLTITSIETQPAHRFSIMLIPHTQLNVTLSLKSVGSSVNLEFDMLVKSIVNVVEFSLKDQLQEMVSEHVSTAISSSSKFTPGGCKHGCLQAGLLASKNQSICPLKTFFLFQRLQECSYFNS